MTFTTSIIIAVIFILIIGFGSIVRRLKRIVHLINNANEFLNKFITLANQYYSSYNSFDRSGNLDQELYVWLTKNVSEMQGNLGSYGVMVYRAPLGAFVANNYQILINTLPKFAQNNVDQFEVNSSRDCLLRYAGSMELLESKERGKLKNPLIWFAEGFRQLLALPVYMLNWFGVLNDRSVRKFTGNLFLNSSRASSVFWVASVLW